MPDGREPGPRSSVLGDREEQPRAAQPPPWLLLSRRTTTLTLTTGTEGTAADARITALRPPVPAQTAPMPRLFACCRSSGEAARCRPRGAHSRAGLVDGHGSLARRLLAGVGSEAAGCWSPQGARCPLRHRLISANAP